MFALLIVSLVLPAAIPADATGATSCADALAKYNEQKDSAAGFVGMCEPKCKADGTYAAVQCCGNACYCSDPTGEQILDYSVPIKDSESMTCACALEDKEIQSSGLRGRYVNCEQNGDYAPRQCTGSVCHCVDAKTGTKVEGSEMPIGSNCACPRQSTREAGSGNAARAVSCN